MAQVFQNRDIHKKNAFASDMLLFHAASHLPLELLPGFEEIGDFVVSSEARDLARLANAHPARLNLTNSWGQKQQNIEMHPAYHALVRRTKRHGLSSSLWENIPEENSIRYQARAIRLFLMSGLENGHLSEIITTSAGTAVLMGEAELYHSWKNILLSRHHDAAEQPIHRKKGANFAFAFQNYGQKNGEKDGNGQAQLISFDHASTQNIYQISAIKTRVANPQADAFFVTAELKEGLSCFFVPRFQANGAFNHIKIDHMRHEMGYRSRPLAQLNFQNSAGWLIGPAGEGGRIVQDIETMLRFDEAVIAAGALRSIVQFALSFLKQRHGPAISPLTLRVLADIALDVAAAEAFVLRLAKAFDYATQEKSEAAFARIMTPVASFWINNLVAPILSETLAHLGPDVYEENSWLACFFKDACARPLRANNINSTIEDVVYSAQRAPNLFQEMIINLGKQINAIGEKTSEILYTAMQIAFSDIASGRLFVEQLAYTASLAALNDYDIPDISSAFADSRLGGQWRSSYGMLSARHNVARILETLYPSH